MGERGELSHRGSQGDDVNDRLGGHGHRCAGSAGENIAQTWYQENLGNGKRYDTPKELAAGVVDQLANSDEHRENLLYDYDEIGIGVAVVEEEEGTAIYVTQVFC